MTQQHTQPKALLLAEYLDVMVVVPKKGLVVSDAASELRRLHEVEKQLKKLQDHTLFGMAICKLGARWKAWEDGKIGEFCIGGFCYATDLDEFGLPIINGAMRRAIEAEKGGQQ